MATGRGVIAGMLVLLGLALSGCQTGQVNAETLQDRLEAGRAALPDDAAGLAPVFDDLFATELGLTREPVVVIQLGDSHTAGDHFTSRLRELLQQQFGRAGRGVLPAGTPYPYVELGLVAATQGDGWASLSSFPTNPGGLFSHSGHRLVGGGSGESVSLQSTEPEGFSRVILGVVLHPSGGSFGVTVDGAPLHEQSTRADQVRAGQLDLQAPPGSRQMTIMAAGDGPVELLYWGLQRAGPGVVVDSHGVVGANLGIIESWDQGTVSWGLRQREPSLVVLAFGTNEAFDLDFDQAAYAALVDRQVSLIEQAVPDAAILLVGPPDANRLPRPCWGGDLRETALDYPCAPLSDEERGDYSRVFGESSERPICRWHPPPALSVVRTVQQEVAEARGHGFWDWSTVMGGGCGVHRWAMADPPLAFFDHVHLQPDGYALSADRLFAYLMGHYAQFRAAALGS